ncbi:MAG: carboxypeptidase regulatory-like domain-containing protein [Planctomycetota bacterium]
MKNRLALPVLLLMLLAAAAWVVFGNPQDPDALGPDGMADPAPAEIESGSLEGSGNGPAAGPRRTDLEGSGERTPDSAAAKAAAQSLASFHGRVVGDQGTPLPGVEIQAFGLIGWASGFDGDPSKLAASWETTTDEDGFFAFPETPRDRLRFLIEFRHPEFSTAELSNQPATVGRSRDLGTIELGPGFRLEGTVFDAFGNPLAEADVIPFRDTTRFNFSNLNADLRPLADAVRTDASGAFRIEGLPARQVRLKAQAAHNYEAWSSSVVGRHGDAVDGIEIHLGAAREAFGVILDDQRQPVVGARIAAETKGTGERNSAESISDSTGRFDLTLPQSSEGLFLTVGAQGFWIEEVDLEKNPVEGSIEIQLTPIPSLDGLILDENGRAIPGATVRLVENRQGLINPRDMLANAETVTAADGTFKLLPNLRDAWGGRFTVYAWDKTHPTGSSEMFRLRNANGFKAPDLTITLGTGFRAYGTIVDPDGEALAGARIHLRALTKPRRNPLGQEPGTQRGGDIFAHTTSQADGSFSFDGLAPGDYRLEAYFGGYSPAESEDFGLVDSDFVAQLQLVESCGIDGIVQGPIDAFPNLRVTASSPGLDSLDTQVDAQGRFLFEEIMPGNWNLRLQDGDQDNSGSSFLWGNGEPLARLDGLRVPPGELVPATLELDLSGRGTVSGTVNINGSPAADYSIFLMPQTTGAADGNDVFGGRNLVRQLRVATTDFAGHYGLAGVPSADYWVVLCRPGTFPANLNFGTGAGGLPAGLQRREVLLRDGASQNVDFDVHSGSLAFEVSNPTQGNTTRARLLPEPEDGRRVQSFYLRSRGHVIEDLASGRYQMQLKVGQDWLSTPVDVPSGARETMVLELPTVEKSGKASTGAQDQSKPPR